MSFEKKKIHLETLGEYLSAVRVNLKLSTAEVAAQTGIKPKFLNMLEAGEFLKLPPDVYVTGFLSQLSALYGADAATLVKQYKKEKSIQLQLDSKSARTASFKNKFLDRLIITPKTVSFALGGIFVAVVLLYIIWQVASINKTPGLEILEPRDRQVIKGTAVKVAGRTDAGMRVAVNGQSVFVDSAGNFEIQLGLNSGPREFTITAQNKFDKTVTKTVSVIGESSQAEEEKTSVQLKMEFSGDAEISFSVDGQKSQNLTFKAGEIKQLEGREKVVISTSNAGAVKVTLNGKELGLMGRNGERLENVPFFAESDNIKE